MKKFIVNVLNGTSTGIVLALVPAAVLSEVIKLLLNILPELKLLMNMLLTTNSFLGLAIGLSVAAIYQLTMIESVAVGFTTQLAGGAIQYTPQGFVLKGTGDIITMMLTAALAISVVQHFPKLIKQYSVLLATLSTILTAGLIGRICLPYLSKITETIGQWIAQLLTFEQTTMSILIAMVFAYLIVSPLSSAGIAIAISLSGVGAGAANLGICATMFGLAIAGRRVNKIGVCLAHIFGSPKMSLTNVMLKPILILPLVMNAGILGVGASFFNVQGTPTSAGLGLIGMVGPLTHLSLNGWTLVTGLVTIMLFFVLPVILGYLSDKLFKDYLKWIKDEDYRVTI